MPCHDHYPTNEETRANEEIQALKARLDHVTDLLCQLGHSTGVGAPTPQAVKDWWTQHAKEDKATQAQKPTRKFKVT